MLPCPDSSLLFADPFCASYSSSLVFDPAVDVFSWLVYSPRIRLLAARQRYHQLSRMAQALDVLLPLVQDVAEMQGGGDCDDGILPVGVVPEMGEEDHALLDRLEKRRALVKRSISDVTSRSFGSVFRYSIAFKKGDTFAGGESRTFSGAVSPQSPFR